MENEMANNCELGDNLSRNICLLYPYYSVRYIPTTYFWTVVCLMIFFILKNDIQTEIIRQLFLEHTKI